MWSRMGHENLDVLMEWLYNRDAVFTDLEWLYQLVAVGVQCINMSGLD